jgi:hypothetical protein
VTHCALLLVQRLASFPFQLSSGGYVSKVMISGNVPTRDIESGAAEYIPAT